MENHPSVIKPKCTRYKLKNIHWLTDHHTYKETRWPFSLASNCLFVVHPECVFELIAERGGAGTWESLLSVKMHSEIWPSVGLLFPRCPEASATSQDWSRCSKSLLTTEGQQTLAWKSLWASDGEKTQRGRGEWKIVTEGCRVTADKRGQSERLRLINQK